MHAYVHSSICCPVLGISIAMACRPILDEVAQVQYEVSDAEYAANEVEDTWVQSLLGRLGAYLNTLQPLLTPANYEQLVSFLLEKVSMQSMRGKGIEGGVTASF